MDHIIIKGRGSNTWQGITTGMSLFYTRGVKIIF